jgi:hypothetical protein
VHTPSVRSKYDEWIPAAMMLDKTPENEQLQRELNYALTAAGKAEAQRKLAEGAFGLHNQFFGLTCRNGSPAHKQSNAAGQFLKTAGIISHICLSLS